jgi:CubicO group peptidase (beta-lactamase class C family)
MIPKELFSEFADPGAPGASVLVLSEGRMVHGESFGLANVEEGTPCSAETNFRLASLTKQFTAMAILILMERKELSLDECLVDFFAESPSYGEKITVRHLLSHTSGVLDYEDLIPAGTTLPLRDADVLRLLLECNETYFPPGSKYRYSNSGYALLALAIEVRSGTRFASFLQQHIFRPLGMGGTVAYERGVSQVHHRAYGYKKSDGGFERDDQSLTSSVLGDGGIYSSTSDLAKWDQALYTEQLVSAPIRELAFTGVTATEHPGTEYGFGWFIGQYRGLKEVWHYGETVGFTTRISRFPARRFTTIILANRSGANIGARPHLIADRLL